MTDSSESLLLFFGVWTKQSNFSIFQKEEAEKIYAKHLRWNRFFPFLFVIQILFLSPRVVSTHRIRSSFRQALTLNEFT